MNNAIEYYEVLPFAKVIDWKKKLQCRKQEDLYMIFIDWEKETAVWQKK